MGKIKQSPKRPAEERHRQLLQVAHRLFMKKGFRDTTIEDIARKAGLTKGAFYFHFNKKEDVLIELLEGMHGEILRAFGAMPDGGANPAHMLRILSDKHSCGDEPEFGAFLDFWAEVMKVPRAARYLQKCFLESDRLMVKKIDPRYGKTPTARRDLGIMILALFDGLAVRGMMSKGSVNYDRQLKQLGLMLEGLATTNGRQRTKTTKAK